MQPRAPTEPQKKRRGKTREELMRISKACCLAHDRAVREQETSARARAGRHVVHLGPLCAGKFGTGEHGDQADSEP